MIILVNLSTFRWDSGTPWGRIYQRNVCHICKCFHMLCVVQGKFLLVLEKCFIPQIDRTPRIQRPKLLLDGYPDLLGWISWPVFRLKQWAELDWEWAGCQPSFQFHFASRQALPNLNRSPICLFFFGIFPPSGGSHFIHWCSSNCKFRARVHLFSKILKKILNINKKNRNPTPAKN